MNYLSNYSTSGDSSFLVIIVLIFGLTLLVSMMLMFRKAGYSWWKVLIPIYNLFCYHELIGLPGSFTIAYIFLPGLSIIPLAGFLIPIVLFIMHCVECNNTAKAFGKDTGWAILIFLFEPIMFIIIGFSPNIEYVYGGKKVAPRLVPVNNGNQPMNFDPNTGQPINNVQPVMNFDPNTGQPINNGVTSQTVAPQPVEQPTQPPQINSDLPDSIESIIIKQ